MCHNLTNIYVYLYYIYRYFCHLSGVQHVLTTSRDPDKLLHTWEHYQKRFSSKIEEYSDILQLTNVAAKANGEN